MSGSTDSALKTQIVPMKKKFHSTKKTYLTKG